MKYMLLIYGNVTQEQVQAMSDEERRQLYSEWGELNRTPGMTGGVQMDDPGTATTVRVEGGQALTTDGPFVETKEALGGYFFLEADDLDAAIAVAATVPPARRGGAVEVRPVVER